MRLGGFFYLPDRSKIRHCLEVRAQACQGRKRFGKAVPAGALGHRPPVPKCHEHVDIRPHPIRRGPATLPSRAGPIQGRPARPVVAPARPSSATSTQRWAAPDRVGETGEDMSFRIPLRQGGPRAGHLDKAPVCAERVISHSAPQFTPKKIAAQGDRRWRPACWLSNWLASRISDAPSLSPSDGACRVISRRTHHSLVGLHRLHGVRPAGNRVQRSTGPQSGRSLHGHQRKPPPHRLCIVPPCSMTKGAISRNSHSRSKALRRVWGRFLWSMIIADCVRRSLHQRAFRLRATPT